MALSGPHAVKCAPSRKKEGSALGAIQPGRFDQLLECLPGFPLTVQSDWDISLHLGRGMLGSNQKEPAIALRKIVRELLIAFELGSLRSFIARQEQDEKLVAREAARIDRAAAAPLQIDVWNPEVEFGGEHLRGDTPPAARG